VSESQTNVKSLLLGGVAAAIVLNAGDWVTNNYLIADLWRHFAQTHNAVTENMNGIGPVIQFAAIDTLLGFLLVWVYAAIRPRLGPGPGTAIIATFVVFGAETLELATFGGWLIPWDLLVRTSALTLVSMLLAGWAGAWVYKEETQVFD